MLIREGEPGDSMLVIADGSATVSKEGVEINRVGRGECCGEMAYMDESRHPRSASVRASAGTTAIEITLDSLARASDALPMNSVVQDHYGDVLARLGRQKEAALAWEKALNGDGEEIDRAAIERKVRGGAPRGRK